MQIDTSKLTAGEIELLQWQYNGDMGHFKTSLWKAIQHADNGNLHRLGQGFPDQVQAYLKFTSEEGYWHGLLERAGLIPTAHQAAADPTPVPPNSKTPYDH